MARARRDLDETTAVLEAWLQRQVSAEEVSVSELSVPKAGFSNETLLGRARWSAADGMQDLRFALRVEPTAHQLFLEPDAMFQARMMRELARHEGVPVPSVLFEETDPGVLGAPFFMMEHVEGRIPPDVPPWHAGGWAAELAPDERGQLYDNGLSALVALHSIDWRDGFGFLERSGPGAIQRGTALDHYLERVRQWYEWSRPSLRWATDVIDAAVQVLESGSAGKAGDDGAVVTWGDARVGNMIFAEDLSVAAMLDWEGAALGPAEIDLGWWLMFEEFFCEALGAGRLDGVPGREGTVARYEQLAGRTARDIEYYEILAGLVFALINSRLANLTIARGVPEHRATAYLMKTTDMLGRHLEGRFAL